MLQAAQNDSRYGVGLELPRLATEATKTLAKVSLSIPRTANSLQLSAGPGDRWTVLTILWLISNKALVSILKGTVAYDGYTERLPWYPEPNSSDRWVGIYVIGLSRIGMKGEFLNLVEMEQLVKGLEEYIEGSRVRADGTNLSANDRRLLDWVKRVDGIKDTHKHTSSDSNAFFISSAPGAIDALLAMFKSRCSIVRKLDSTGLVRQRQSPLYVGCSVNLRDRLARYKNYNLRAINKPLGLTISILAALRLDVEMVRKVAIRVWRPGQLPIAEQLVTTLASSLVFQAGFNAIEAGGNNPPDTMQADAEWYAVGIMPFYKSSIKESLDEANDRWQFVQKCKEADLSIQDLGDQLSGLELYQAQAASLCAVPWAGQRMAMQGDVARLLETSNQIHSSIAALALCHPRAYAELSEKQAREDATQPSDVD
jgi:hypothetical protein